MDLHPIIADNWLIDGGVAFGVVPRSLWSRWHEYDDNNMIRVTNRCLLVHDGNRIILIDTGFGNKRPEKYYTVRYLDPEIGIFTSLATAGYKPDEVTDVIFTHLHDDHAGGATMVGSNGTLVPAFPNAHYWVSESQWQWAHIPNKREAAAYFADNHDLLLHSGQLHLLKNGEQPFNNILLKYYNGHTRGQIVPCITYLGHTVAFMADFIPAASNIPLPYIASVDIEPLLSLSEKEEFLNEAYAGNWILFFEHDASHECCNLKAGEKYITTHQLFSLTEIETKII